MGWIVEIDSCDGWNGTVDWDGANSTDGCGGWLGLTDAADGWTMIDHLGSLIRCMVLTDGWYGFMG